MTDIYVYGSIGEDGTAGSSSDMTAHRFAYLMQQANGDDVVIHINSGGGNVFEANAMAEVIRSYKGSVEAYIEGLAASAASYFALTADIVKIAPSALLMIHNPWGVCVGEAGDMRQTADMLDVVKTTIVNQYTAKTGLEVSAIEDYMDAETWFTADEAIELGFCDSYTEQDMKLAACVSKDILNHFKNKPENLVISDEVKPQVNEAPQAPLSPDNETAGDLVPNISEEVQGQTEVEATEAEAEAATKVECINGMFLVK